MNKLVQPIQHKSISYNISELIESLNHEQDIDKRSRIIRRLGECGEPEALKCLLKLKCDLEKENEFIQYEIKLSLRQLIEDKQLLNNSELNVDFILDHLTIGHNPEETSNLPRILIDSHLLEEYVLRSRTTLFYNAAKVIDYIFSAKIAPYIGVKGVRQIWSSLKEHKGQECANQFVLELLILNGFTLCGVDAKNIDLDKYPNLNIPTVVQIEIARHYNLDGILTLRDKDFIGSDYPYVYSHPMFAQAIEDSKTGLVSLRETLKKFNVVDATEKKRQELANLYEDKHHSDSWFEGDFSLFDGWEIKTFEILTSSNHLTSATVILVDEKANSKSVSSAFRVGAIDALISAFDEALVEIVGEIKHELKEIYVANLTLGKKGKITAQAIVKTGEREVVTIHTHKNITKAYFFAYLQAIIAIYAPHEYKSSIHSREELMSLYQIGRRDFHQLNFSKIDLSNYEANLAKSNLKKCDFCEANLSGANLTDADLEGADFSYADLTNVQVDAANLNLFRETILINTKFPAIHISADGKSRIDKVSHLLKQANPEISKYQVSAIYRMTTPAWWNSELGEEFWQVNQHLLSKGIPVQRIFILPQDPKSEHLDILRRQASAGVIIRYVCQYSAKNLDHYDLSDINVLVCENLSVEQNSFTTGTIFHEQEESKGYISFKQSTIQTNKERFSLIWNKSEAFSLDSSIVVCRS